VWLGFARSDAPSAEEQPTFEVLGDIVGFALFRMSLEASTVEAARGESTGPDLTTGEIISLAAHELRTPLTPATMLLQSLERKARAGITDVDAIVRTRRQVGRMSQMVSDLLDLTRLREGRLVLTPVLLEVGSCLSRAVSAFREADPRRRVDLSIESEPLVILSDEDRFSQAVTALLDHIARQPPLDSAIQVTLARRSDRAAIRIACERPSFPPDLANVTTPPRPAPLPLSAILAQALVMRFGGTMSFTAAHDSPSAAEVTFPMSTADKG
jgi:signal transduction histidine kinase